MNSTGSGNLSAASVIGNQQLSQQQQQVTSTPQINHFIPMNGTALDVSPSTRRGPVLPIGNMLGAKRNAQIQQGYTFDPAPDQELQRQMDDFKKTVTVVLWYKARTEPLRIQHTTRSFPFFTLSSLTSVVHDLRLADDSYLDTYVPESDQWVQHTVHTVRIVESQQRLLYRIRKSLLEDINAEECTSLPAELELQKQVSSSKKHLPVNEHRPPMDTGLPTPITPAMTVMMKDAQQEKSTRKRPAPGNEEFEHRQSQTPKIHIPNSFYLSPQSEVAEPQPMSSGSASMLPSDAVVDENDTSASGSVDAVSHGVPSTGADYLYQGPIYYATHPSTSTSPHHQTDTSHLHSHQTTTGPVAYQHNLPIKRWPNDYTVAEISAGFHDMDRLVAQTPNLTQRLAFERIFGSRYVKSTVCRHRGVWKRASRAMKEQFIALGHDDRASWGEFVRTVEGRQAGKVGVRNDPNVASSSHDPIEFPAGGSEGGIVNLNAGSDALQDHGVPSHDNNSGSVEEPIMGSLQNHAAPTSSSADPTLPPELNVFDPSLSHMPNSQA